MAELATPSAASISTSDPAPTKNGKPPVVKPERPDEEQFKAAEAKLEKELKAAQDRVNKIQEKFSNRPNNKDSPAAKRLQEIRDEQDEIRKKQASNKNSTAAIQEKKKKLEETMKLRINELNTAKGKTEFKSVEDIDRKIKALDAEVESGRGTLLSDKKALADISSLHKLKKSFGGFAEQQKEIDSLKAQIAEQNKALNDPERKALSDRYSALKAESDKLYGESQSARKDQNAIWDERNKARAAQQEKYVALKQLRDAHYGALREYKNYEREARKIKQEKWKAEQDAYHSKKRKDAAAQRLEEASAPAYQDEILTAEGLIRYFDPSALPAKTESGPGKFAISSQRTVDDSVFKGMKVAKKDDQDYFQGTGGKKGKKGRKATATPTEAKKSEDSEGAEAAKAKRFGKDDFNLSIGVLDQLAKVGLNPPATKEEIPSIVTKLQEKLAHWKSDQKRKTEENIAKAQKEIDRLEAEGAAEGSVEGSRDAAMKPAQANQGINGKVSAEAELQQEKDAAADVAEDLEKAKIEDASAES